MKKNQFYYCKMAATIFITLAITSTHSWCVPSFIAPDIEYLEADSSAPAPVQNIDSSTIMPEERQLINLLENDGLISQITGFIVEKNQNKLFVNGVQLPNNIASKYIANIKKDEIRVEVFPFMERLRQHPDAGILQLLLPVMLSSPCVDNKTKKPGC